MLVLSALCVLLPLVAALESCDKSKTEAFLAHKLEGNLLDNFGGKDFWFVAVSAENARDSKTVEAIFGSVSGSSVPVQFVYNGETAKAESVTYTLEGDHIVTGSNSLYFFQCSKNLVAAYRCTEGSTGSGPDYFIWATKDKTEAVVSAELEHCQAKITAQDKDTTFARRGYP